MAEQRLRRNTRPASTRRTALLTNDPETVTPADKAEIYPFFALGVILGFIALLVCFRKNYVLLYGDAVAHLGIARRIIDAHYPGIAQLGGVWLPLPHVLMLPFIGKMPMWQTGLAAVPMSMLSYALSVAGVWRLSRRLMRARWCLVATLFYALNANLLFLSTTAMTEALFLALLVWVVAFTAEAVAALRARTAAVARSRMLLAGVLVLAMVFTRYDGWIVGAVVWTLVALAWWRSPLRDELRGTMAVFTVLCACGPLLWFWYNAHFEHDWLDFIRGPYSAAAIERRTAPPGQHYRGWHNPFWALLFYTRTAQLDAAAWETGFVLMFASLWGLARQIGRRTEQAAVARAEAVLALLWLPLPFYVYSIAWGSVPIFIPQLWPHSFYNARYGMELLPALAVYGAFAGEQLELWLKRGATAVHKIGARFWHPAAMLLSVANCLAMMYFIPLVLKEGIVNASTRVPFEHALASVMEQWPPDAPVMMSTSAHVGAVQTAGRALRSMVSEDDEVTWEHALVDPAHNAAYVIAIAGDAVDNAVKAHPDGLSEVEVICTSGQPCARIFTSSVYSPATPQ